METLRVSGRGGINVKINYTFEIDAVSAFQTLCKTLYMQCVLDEDTDYCYRNGTAYDVFTIKRKLMLEKYGIRVKEV